MSPRGRARRGPRTDVWRNSRYVCLALDWRAHGARADGPRALEHRLVRAWHAAQAAPGGEAKSVLFLDTVFDLLALVDYARLRPDVDAGRVGAVGVGLGGLLAAVLAAVDERVACCCSVAGLYSPGFARDHGAWDSLLANRRCVTYLDLELATSGQHLGLKPAAEKIAEARAGGGPVGPELFAELMAAWVAPAADAALFDPRELLPRIAPRPLGVLAGDLDELCPAELAEAAVAAARPAYAALGAADDRLELVVFEDVLLLLPRAMDVAAAAFLNRHLLPAAEAAEPEAAEAKAGAEGELTAGVEFKYGPFAASPLDLGPRAGYEFRDGARGRGYYASPQLLRLAAGAAAEG